MKRAALLFCLFFFAKIAFSQPFEVSGKVVSAADGSTLIGASIAEKGSKNGAVTDADGLFSLKIAAPDGFLIINYIGFEALEIAVLGRAALEIELRQSSAALSEVVVTGYKKEIRSDVASAISSIKSKNIERLVVSGIDQALQGQAAGVAVTQVTGAPGDDIAVRIRGAGTLGNNSPLFVIDGVPTTANINMFSPADIESIEVLKDGAAAAIYGARAANGVVLITTKRGKSGKPVFSFEAFSGIQQPVRLPQLLNASDFLMIRNEAILNANTLRNPANQIQTYDPAILDTLPDTDWLGLVFAPAPIRQIALSASGGGEGGSFFMSGEYRTQDGIFAGQKFDKYQIRMNGDLGKGRFRIGENLSFSTTDRRIVNSSGDGFGPGNELSGIRYALIASPLFSPTRPDGTPYNTTTELAEPTIFGDGNPNPLVFIENTDWRVQRYRVFGNVFAELSFWKNLLKIRTSLGGDLNFEKEKLFKKRLSEAIYSPTSLNEGRVFNRTLTWNTTADAQKTVGKSRFSALAGMEAIQNETDYLGASARNFRRDDPLFRYISGATAEDFGDVNASGISTEWALVSYFGQVGWSFDRRFVVNATARRDGSSRFGNANRWGIFPSVSAAWNVSNEAFFQQIKAVSSLKIRASWGQLGNQEIGIYPYSSLVRTGQPVYVFGDQIATGATIQETGNARIKWETSEQTNLGLDASFWAERLSLTVDFFKKRTQDILVRVPVPQAAGTERPPFLNAAEVENRGLEASLIFKNRWRGLRSTFGLNVSAIQNEVISIAGSEPILGGFGLSDGPLTKTEPGQPVGSFFLWQMDGIFQTQAEIDASPFQTKDTRPGDVKFADLNADQKIDDKDRRHVGSPFPAFSYGFQVGFEWKNFDFSMLAQGVRGNDVYFLYGNFAYETQLRGFNSYQKILERWTPENPSQTFPKVSIDDRNGNRRPSTRFLEDGSYLKIRNVTVGCDLKKWLPRARDLGSLRLYATIQNALTFTKYSGLDPEIQANANDTRGLGIASDLAVGIDWGTVPAPRTFLFGLKTSF